MKQYLPSLYALLQTAGNHSGAPCQSSTSFSPEGAAHYSSCEQIDAHWFLRRGGVRRAIFFFLSIFRLIYKSSARKRCFYSSWVFTNKNNLRFFFYFDLTCFHWTYIFAQYKTCQHSAEFLNSIRSILRIKEKLKRWSYHRGYGWRTKQPSSYFL